MKKIVLLLFISAGFYSLHAQVRVGNNAPEISLPNALDSLVSLSSFKGKVVLIDFWASWCGPCRQQNPSVVRLYKKYKNRGFEVYGISLDVKKNLWLKAVKKDKITYSQVIDTNGWDSKAAEKYGVFAIPTSFLVDKDGMISAIDADGKELDNLVAALLNR